MVTAIFTLGGFTIGLILGVCFGTGFLDESWKALVMETNSCLETSYQLMKRTWKKLWQT